MQTIDAINQMLGSAGIREVNSLDSTHRFTGTALNVLNRYRKRVLAQGSGWWFNRDYVTLQPDTDGKVYVPNDAMAITKQPMGVSLRDRALYNNAESTDKFTSSVTLWLVKDMDFELIPEVVAQYIADCATVAFQSTYDGDSTKTRSLEIARDQSRIEANADEIRNARFNSFNNIPRVLYVRSVVAYNR